MMIVKDQFKMRDRIPLSLKEITEKIAEETVPADRQLQKSRLLLSDLLITSSHCNYISAELRLRPSRYKISRLNRYVISSELAKQKKTNIG